MIYVNTGDFEGMYRPIIDLILTGDCPLFRALRLQLQDLELYDSFDDGYGIWLRFHADSKFRILNPELRNRMISEVVGIDSEGKVICFFTLYLDDGLISDLEGCPTRTNYWPREEVELRFVTSDEHGQDLIVDARGQSELAKYLIGGKVRIASGEVD